MLLFGRSRSRVRFRRRICGCGHKGIRILVGLRILSGQFSFLLTFLFLFLCQFSHALSLAVVVLSQFGFLIETFYDSRTHIAASSHPTDHRLLDCL